MEIKLKEITGNRTKINEILRLSQTCGRHCYSEKDWEELEKEPHDSDLIKDMIKKGHHSVFDHINLTFSMKNLPKVLAMELNNEKVYNTSEKSARYTQMNPIKEQKEKYNKWMGIFEERISQEYPQSNYQALYTKDRTGKTPIQKLAQENARYMTSVFTPTKMVHTIPFAQLNHVAYYLEEFIEKKTNKNEFNNRLIPVMEEFLEKIKGFRVDGLKNQTDRHLSFFGRDVEGYYGDVYSIKGVMSFACLAQAQRHRTINYQIAEEIELGAEHGFHIPKIIRKTDLRKDWIIDLSQIAKTDFPQAQLIPVTERGIIEDYRSKLMLRLCGHAQHEIMERTLAEAKIYSKNWHKFDEEWLKPKCQQGFTCGGNCMWTGKNALERII